MFTIPKWVVYDIVVYDIVLPTLTNQPGYPLVI